MVSQVEGILQDFPFREGDMVSKGDVLAQIDQTKMQTEVEELEARTAFARLDLERTEELIATEGASQELLDKAQTEYRISKAKLSKAQAILEDATIRARFSGIVAARSVEVGDVVLSRMKLLEVLEAEPDVPHAIALRFKAYVSERRIKDIEVGQKSEVRLDACPGETFIGRLSRIYPEVDPRTRMVAVEIELPNPDGRLRPGLSGTAQVILLEKENAVVIPLESLLVRPDGKKVCFVAVGDHAEVRLVKSGIESGGRVEIVHGLSSGELVIVRGQHKLKDGAPIRVQRPAEKSNEKKGKSAP